MKQLLKDNSRELSVVVAIVLMFLIFGTIEPIYLSANNIRDIIEQATIYGLMGIGITGVIITGGIDLSVGSVLALVGAVVAQMTVAGVHPIICIIIGLAFGFTLGTINGILIAKLGLQPFIATMGTMSIYRGLAYVVTKGYPVLGVPDTYRKLVDGELIPYIRVSVIIFFLFAVFMYVVLKKTKLGTYVHSIGGNEEATRLSGVKVDKYKTLIYGLAMLGTALAAMIQIGKLGTGDPTTGQGYELNAIAAAAIGGTSMAGGRGTIHGTVLGAILFAGLKVGLIVMGVDTFYQYIATGLVIAIASYIEVVQTKLSSKPKLSTKFESKSEA
ncbi:monosaccharide ABC transporter membrane protein (CUT2 family) [Alkalibaculum bacchi]|uniref:Monosaccharide ABC transporter membrane protein (CUT2 family) n=1 Tax=Alkalibaculum bacchi TaxID=645887 RepID=A0A366I1S1_9FIRM|nr:ABC transporter permease [Alkalibaculum bacchi]RBP61352.1 monosaccharide ABC transporter membrane protein (CUT2 family) [Alkalibaculum bacchi]